MLFTLEPITPQAKLTWGFVPTGKVEVQQPNLTWAVLRAILTALS